MVVDRRVCFAQQTMFQIYVSFLLCPADRRACIIHARPKEWIPFFVGPCLHRYFSTDTHMHITHVRICHNYAAIPFANNTECILGSDAMRAALPLEPEDEVSGEESIMRQSEFILS